MSDLQNYYIATIIEQSKQIGRLETKVKRLEKANEELIQALWTEINKNTITYITWPVLPEYPPCPPRPCLIRGAR